MTNAIAPVPSRLFGLGAKDLLAYAADGPENRDQVLAVFKTRLANNVKNGKDRRAAANKRNIDRVEAITFEGDAPAPEAPAPAEPTVIQTADAATAHGPVDYLRASLAVLKDRLGSRDAAIIELYENKDRREAVGKVIGVRITQNLIAEALDLHHQRIAQILKAHRESLAAPAHVVDMDALKAALLG